MPQTDDPHQIEFVQDKTTKEPFPVERKVAAMIHKAGLRVYGVSCIHGSGCADGRNGDIVQLAPPYTVSAADVELIVDRMAQAVKHVLG